MNSQADTVRMRVQRGRHTEDKSMSSIIVVVYGLIERRRHLVLCLKQTGSRGTCMWVFFVGYFFFITITVYFSTYSEIYSDLPMLQDFCDEHVHNMVGKNKYCVS